MRAVWSFWTKPFLAHRHSLWASEQHHMMSWVLSVETARQHYPDTRLVTDDAGARLLVDQLGLNFAHVSTALNGLADCNPEWWTLGKLTSYAQQDEPFAHIDSDSYLWKRLPDRVEQAGVFALCPVPFAAGSFTDGLYRTEWVEQALMATADGWLPDEWLWFRHSGQPQRAAAGGLVGGNDVGFMQHYAKTALRMMMHPPNRRVLEQLDGKINHMVMFEEYVLAACAAYHAGHAKTLFKGLTMQHLFERMDESGDPACLTQTGYTHLVSDAKRNPLQAERLAQRVQRDYPEFYERCKAQA